MAENIQETGIPEPPPTPREVPKPTEQPNRSETFPALHESQQSARQDTRDAGRSEYAKATDGHESDGPRPTESPQDSRNDGSDTASPLDESATAIATDTGDLTRVGDGSGPWFDEGTHHHEGGAVRQMTEGSCVSASGEMLTDGRVTQPELLSELGDWSNLSALRDELNSRVDDGAWTGHYFANGGEALRRASEGPMAAQVQAPLGRAHMVMLEPGENGSFTVRDPYDGSSYEVDSPWVEKYVAGGVFR